MKKKIAAFTLAIIFILQSSFSVSAATTIKDLANAQKLTPSAIGYNPLDNAVKKVLDKIITPQMTQYEKLVKIYNYNVTKYTYGNDHDWFEDKDNPDTFFWRILDERYNPGIYRTLLKEPVCMNAMDVLTTKRGVCDNYSAAFAAMCNTIGFEAHVINGRIKLANGNWNGHAWTLVKLGDSYYIFDPQAEQVNMRDGKIRYINFAIPASSAKYKEYEDQFKLSKIRRTEYLNPSKKVTAQKLPPVVTDQTFDDYTILTYLLPSSNWKLTVKIYDYHDDIEYDIYDGTGKEIFAWSGNFDDPEEVIADFIERYS